MLWQANKPPKSDNAMYITYMVCMQINILNRSTISFDSSKPNDSENGLAPVRRKPIFCANAQLSSIEPSEQIPVTYESN